MFHITILFWNVYFCSNVKEVEVYDEIEFNAEMVNTLTSINGRIEDVEVVLSVALVGMQVECVLRKGSRGDLVADDETQFRSHAQLA